MSEKKVIVVGNSGSESKAAQALKNTNVALTNAGKSDKRMMMEAKYLGMFKKIFSDIFGSSKGFTGGPVNSYSPANFRSGGGTFKTNQRKERKRSWKRKIRRSG